MARSSRPDLKLTITSPSSSTPQLFVQESFQHSLAYTDRSRTLECVTSALSIGAQHFPHLSSHLTQFHWTDLTEHWTPQELQLLEAWATAYYLFGVGKAPAGVNLGTFLPMLTAIDAINPKHGRNAQPTAAHGPTSPRAGLLQGVSSIKEHFSDLFMANADVSAELRKAHRIFVWLDLIILVKILKIEWNAFMWNFDNWEETEIQIVQKMVFVALHGNTGHQAEAKTELQQMQIFKYRSGSNHNVYSKYSRFPAIHRNETALAQQRFLNYPGEFISDASQLDTALHYLAQRYQAQPNTDHANARLHGKDNQSHHEWHPITQQQNHPYHSALPHNPIDFPRTPISAGLTPTGWHAPTSGASTAGTPESPVDKVKRRSLDVFNRTASLLGRKKKRSPDSAQ